MAGKPYIIALEEHYHDADIVNAMAGQMEGRKVERLRQRLDDVGALRIADMDEAGVDFQVLSHGAPSTQRLSSNEGVALARRINDRLADAVKAHPKRFAAFGAIPTAEPKAAADELERVVTSTASSAPWCMGSATACSSTTRGSGRSSSGAGARRADLSPSRRATSDGDRALFQGLHGDASGHRHRGLGLHHGDGDARHPHGAVGRVRRLSQAELHPGPSRRDDPVLVVAHRHDAGRDGAHAKGFRERFIEHFYITTSGFFSTTRSSA